MKMWIKTKTPVEQMLPQACNHFFFVLNCSFHPFLRASILSKLGLLPRLTSGPLATSDSSPQFGQQTVSPVPFSSGNRYTSSANMRNFVPQPEPLVMPSPVHLTALFQPDGFRPFQDFSHIKSPFLTMDPYANYSKI